VLPRELESVFFFPQRKEYSYWVSRGEKKSTFRTIWRQFVYDTPGICWGGIYLKYRVVFKSLGACQIPITFTFQDLLNFISFSSSLLARACPKCRRLFDHNPSGFLHLFPEYALCCCLRQSTFSFFASGMCFACKPGFRGKYFYAIFDTSHLLGRYRGLDRRSSQIVLRISPFNDDYTRT
jgi:hypothetical protein